MLNSMCYTTCELLNLVFVLPAVWYHYLLLVSYHTLVHPGCSSWRVGKAWHYVVFSLDATGGAIPPLISPLWPCTTFWRGDVSVCVRGYLISRPAR